MSESTPRNWLKISCIGCAGLPCIALLLTFGFVKCQVNRIGSDLEPELAKLKKLGVPTTPEELKPNPPVPDEENALAIYSRAEAEWKKLQKDRPRSEILLMRDYSGHPNDTREYAANLGFYNRYFTILSELPTKPRIDWKYKYDELGFDIDQNADVRQFTKVLAARTRFEVLNRHYDRALDLVDLQFRIANHLFETPLLISHLVAFACQSIAYESFDHVMFAAPPTATLLSKAEAILNRQKMPKFREALYGELVFVRLSLQGKLKTNLQDEFSSTPNSVEEFLEDLSTRDESVARMFEAKAVGMYLKIFEGMPDETKDPVATKKYFEEVNREVEADDSLVNRFNQLLFPVFDGAMTSYMKSTAERRVRLAALRLAKTHLANPPANLPNYGELTIDPMDGKPLRYKRTGKGFIVWSLGQDFDDDGGRRRTKGVSFRDFDIVFGFNSGLTTAPPLSRLLPSSSTSAVPGGPGTGIK